MASNIWGALKQASANGALSGGFPFAGQTYFVGSGEPPVPVLAQNRTGTIQEAVNLMISGDVLLIGPGGYDESITIPEGLNNITLIGGGNRGACFIEPSATAAEGLLVLGDDVSLYNIGVASGATADYALKIGSQTVSPARFRAYGCKFEGNESVNPAGQVVLQGCGDVILDDCEICWGVNGIIGRANDDGYPTEIVVSNCRFHDLTTVHIGIKVGDHFVNLWLKGNNFDTSEAGTPPTDFILLSDNANIGTISLNSFASATNATGTITIGTGLKYPTNFTEAGPSAARPA